MEFRCGNFLFFSNFDSGNLARVERVKADCSGDDSTASGQSTKNSFDRLKCYDQEFNIWTSPDCQGTEFENANRTWFYYGVKGGTNGQTVRFNIMNMNKQGKLYSQGMAPIVKTGSSKNSKWQRIRDRPSHVVIDGQFILSFTHTFTDPKNPTYFAFCYPFSYSDCQKKLASIDQLFFKENTVSEQKKTNDKDIYYHRELLTHSLEKRRIDLITVTSRKGILEETESDLPCLFPEKDNKRCRLFKRKKVFFVTSRVHPGETPGSFVFNGFLDFILKTNDPRAAVLRDYFVFKLVPLLNPDGVYRGFYRTDTRGVNLNRVYENPDPELHPAIFAVKTLIMYHHTLGKQKRLNCVCDGVLLGRPDRKMYTTTTCGDVIQSCDKQTNNSDSSSSKDCLNCPLDVNWNVKKVDNTSTPDILGALTNNLVNISSPDGDIVSECLPLADENVKLESTAAQDTNVNDNFSGFLSSNTSKDGNNDETPTEKISQYTGSRSDDFLSVSSNEHVSCKESTASCNTITEEPLSEEVETDLSNGWKSCSCGGQVAIDGEIPSGVGCYIDLHGHASKRGCFIYANKLNNFEDQVKCILLPKLMSVNCANFDFNACNFSERNMYNKDRRDGTSKEGSGRVAIYKATGLIHSYTLECNYNTGKVVNAVPPAAYDCGRATPPPPPGVPPRFTPAIYEEVGRAIAVSVLDIVERNPWSRLLLSEYRGLQGIWKWTEKYVQSLYNAPVLSKKFSREISKTSSLIASSTMIPPVNTGLVTATTTDEKPMTRKGSNGSYGIKDPTFVEKKNGNVVVTKKSFIPVRKLSNGRTQIMEQKAKKGEYLPPAPTQNGINLVTKPVMHLATSQSFLDGINKEKPNLFSSGLTKKVTLLKAREPRLSKIDNSPRSTSKQRITTTRGFRSLSWEAPQEVINYSADFHQDSSRKVFCPKKPQAAVIKQTRSFVKKERSKEKAQGLTAIGIMKKETVPNHKIVFKSENVDSKLHGLTL